MGYPPQIPLGKRKELCGRLLFFDVALPLREKFIKSRGLAVLDSFQKTLFGVLESESGTSANSEPLDKFLQERIARFSNFLPLFSGSHGRLSEELLIALKGAAADLSCQNCSQRSRVCDAGIDDYDLELVARRGLCITSLRQLFETANDGAKTYCSTYGTLYPHKEPPQVTFSTAFYLTRSILHSVPVDYQVGGLTTYAKALAQVELGLVVNKFDLQTYHAVPYVLFHECVAHALHSIFPTIVGREGKASYDPWGEGWMDWVAYQMMEDIVNQRGPAANLSINLPFQLDSIKAALEFHTARVSFERDETSATDPDSELGAGVSLLFFGVEAAKKVYYLLREIFKGDRELAGLYKDIGLPGEEYRAAFYRLSFDLNMHQAFDDRKRLRFTMLINTGVPNVNKIMSPLQLEKERAKKGLFNSIEAILDEYVRTSDIQFLLQSIS
jgi:hypothetical protein